MASARPRSPLELPPRSQAAERSRSNLDAPLLTSASLTGMPVSFGVLLFALAVSWTVGLTLGGLLLHQAGLESKEAIRVLEQRLGQQVAQLTASTSALQEQEELRAQRHAELARELERLTTEVDVLRMRVGTEARAQRARRFDKR